MMMMMSPLLLLPPEQVFVSQPDVAVILQGECVYGEYAPSGSCDHNQRQREPLSIRQIPSLIISGESAALLEHSESSALVCEAINYKYIEVVCLLTFQRAVIDHNHKWKKEMHAYIKGLLL